MTVCEFSPSDLKPARIIIGDDHPLVLSALKVSLQEAWPELAILQCQTLEEVSEAVEKHQLETDMILLDVRMPGSNGLESITALLKKYPSIPLVAISGYADTETIRRLLAAGASGYISKNMELMDMLSAISRVLNGEIWIPENVRDELPSLNATETERMKRLASLSGQQRRILRLIVGGKLNKEIAGELNIAEQTVKIHISSIFRKLGVRTRTQAALVAQDALMPET